ncbi:hypothetical protein [Neobacillus sp. NPDC093127]|uniref:hypothetical protein n=1 Tax=Neobacillus sp. NPDC093127 TaxID=3364296 RepID=UPI00380E7F95
MKSVAIVIVSFVMIFCLIEVLLRLSDKLSGRYKFLKKPVGFLATFLFTISLFGLMLSIPGYVIYDMWSKISADDGKDYHNTPYEIGPAVENNENPGYHQVKGYYRKDGTYVRPYIRSNPDGNPNNNLNP